MSDTVIEVVFIRVNGESVPERIELVFTSGRVVRYVVDGLGVTE